MCFQDGLTTKECITTKDWTQDSAGALLSMINALKERGQSDAAENIRLAAVRKGVEWKKWAKMLGAYLGRYNKKGTEAEYKTATATIWKAKDVLGNDRMVPRCWHLSGTLAAVMTDGSVWRRLRSRS